MPDLCRKIQELLVEKYHQEIPIKSYLNSVNLEEDDSGKIKTFTLSSPSSFHKDRVAQNLLPLIRKELEKLLEGQSFLIKLVVKKKPPTSLKKGISSQALKKKEGFKKTALKPGGLNSKYSFKNFISGPSNMLALSAAQNLSKEPLLNPNSPLFIYGGSGLGKTHLLQALRREILENFKELRVSYLSAERFLYEFVQALSDFSKLSSFKEFYRSHQVLLIDDIQAIKGEATREEFFHTFNAITEKGGLVVCACDRLPREIKFFETRLQTRLSGGLVIQIEPPETGTREAILKEKAQKRECPLSQDILKFLAQIPSTSVRELEGNLNKIYMFCQFQNQKPSLKMVQKLFCNKTSKEDSALVLKRVAAKHKITVDQMLSSRRTKLISKARKEAVLEIHLGFRHLSLQEIGQIFGGRSHSSILHILKKKPKT